MDLVENGADINYADPHGWCPLMLGIKKIEIEIIIKNTDGIYQ